MDGVEPFFQFDPFDLEMLLSEDQDRGQASSSAEADSSTVARNTGKGKGRQALESLSIPSPSSNNNEDPTSAIFSFSPTGFSSNVGSSPSSASPRESYFDPSTPSYDYMSEGYDVPWLQPSTDKGKGREAPPTLPPLTFTPTTFCYETCSWASSSPSSSSDNTPGPSSYGSTSSYSPSSAREERPVSSPPQAEPSSPMETEGNTPDIPSRPRSMASLKSTASSSRSMRKLRSKLDSARVPGNVARKLLFRQRGDASPTSHGLGNYYDSFIAASPPPTPNVTQLPPTPVTPTIDPPFRAQHKVRSYSSPFPLSALDLVPATSNDIFTPIPVEPRNYFDDVLPRELRLHVFASLVSVIVDEHQRTIDEGRWSVSKATQSRNKWVGRDRAVRELVKLSRVSKQWRSMILDGQLWETLDLHAFGGASLASGLLIAEHGGKFVQTLDLSGHTQCTSTDLHALTNDLCLGQFPAATQLSSVNLQGCTSLDSRSLHYLLEHTPLLRRLCVKGLPAVTNLTYKTLAACCPHLQDLDASRCANADASGVSVWARSATVRGTHLEIVRLRLSGLKHVDEDMMLALGRAAPLLEVLDLSYARQLRNSALDAFVACADDDDAEDLGCDTVHVYARELGREGGDRYRRRVTRLRHLALSACPLLTDVACANVAHSVPKLELLELAGIGSSLEDEGLIRLLQTTPNIRRLDLEDATEITDDVLEVLTLEEDGEEEMEKQPGHALEHLVVSNAGELSDHALRALIRGCPNLRVLEADGTSITPTTLRKFVATARDRSLTEAKIVAIDCRGIGEGVVKELAPQTRPRAGWRAYGARKLRYLDARDEIYSELGKDAQDECDEGRVVLQTFHAWLAVDAMAAAREKVRRSQRRNHNSSASSEGDGSRGGSGMRWWSPGGRSRPLLISS
ncbi:hypothetical protein GGG16DRAFT_98720 [Schizophyllum commune]